MQEELREQAKKKVQAKTGFYATLIIFSFTSFVLAMLSFYLPSIGFWLILPIPVFLMVLGLLYLSVFGYSFKGTPTDNWQDAEIEKELIKLYKQKKSEFQSTGKPSESEMLELKTLEKQKSGWEENGDLV
ncbi:MAG: hypothetical protein Sapg2KO_48630 [Saprospiraceae bacterium]